MFLKKTKRDRGAESERRIGEALELLTQRNKFFVKYHHAKKGGEIDAEVKADFIVSMANFMALHIQVKSSRGAVLEHYSKHPHVFAIRVRNEESAMHLSKFIERVVRQILKNPWKSRLKNQNKIPVAD